MEQSVFEKFTRKYSLSKTLRFELKPVGKTLENMRDHLEYDETLQTFFKDQRIEDAYQILKPKIDMLHEQFIGMALEGGHAKELDFSEYFRIRKQLFNLKKNKSSKEKETINLENSLDKEGDKLRSAFGEIYSYAGEKWKEQYMQGSKSERYEWKVGTSVAKGPAVLKSKDMLRVVGDKHTAQDIQDALKVFQGFFTYFGGFNQNRQNYYETKKEAATGVATRIVHENLPRFAENVMGFEARRDDYISAYDFLKNQGKSLINKEDRHIGPITEDILGHRFFNSCLSQKEIETYNEKIGDFNFVVNQYNQVRNGENGFKRLPMFKVLYKQIGCGEKDTLFFQLTHEKEVDVQAAEKRNPNGKYFSVEHTLQLAKYAGVKYFAANENNDTDNLPQFIRYILENDSYKGFYWSKVALNTISNKYFSNWHSLKDRLRDAKVFKKGAKDDEESVKISEVVELHRFFEVLDDTENWETTLFKPSLLDSQNEHNRLEIIQDSKNPHEALLRMIMSDIQEEATKFMAEADYVLDLTSQYFSLPESEKEKGQRKKEWKESIKQWMDHALAVNRMLKYFKVRESKVKDSPIDDRLAKALDTLLGEVDWFHWYDALRNFLTRRPQDDAKENKLKLNFENGSLLGGWSDGQEKSKASVLLKKGDTYFLGVLKKKSLFDTQKEDNPIYTTATLGCGRLILANLKFQTLAGKGFLGKFRKTYGEMGKEDPQQAIISLQDIIKERYVNKYHLLEGLLKPYSDKKQFDKDIQEALKESYVCEFSGINWHLVDRYTDSGDMYLFEIYSKDFAHGHSGKKDLQTIYWKSLFEGSSPHQLNGGGEIFYRKQALKDKHIKKGYGNKPWVIEGKRFTEKAGKFSFHCPIKLNYKSEAKSDPKYAFPFVNKYINESYKESTDIYFLGIDRGEKHLAYYSLVDGHGKITDSGTLNMPFMDKDGNPRMVEAIKRKLDKATGKELETVVACKDYNDLLDARAGDRDYARKNWQTIGTIKELKHGYISQVVHKIAKLAVLEAKGTTFIVLEDLNAGFMRGRQKIEKSVYKQFEVAIAKKLSFLVDKTKDSNYEETGSVTKAIQLTPPVKNFEEFKERGKQAGAMIFVRADYTSQTDPVTGWRKKIYIGSGSENAIREKIVNSFENIRFDGKDYVFTYTDDLTGKRWEIFSGKNSISLPRFYRVRGVDKGEWKSEPQNIVSMLDELFIDFDKDRSLLSQIVDEGKNLKKINEHTAWDSLRFVINLIQQIRNSDGNNEGSKNDFLFSPVRDSNGNHFDSRVFWEKEQQTGRHAQFPSSGDSNGAYNTARKGIIVYEHMKRDFKLAVRDEEWDAWLAGKEFWEKWIKDHEKNLKKK